MTKKAKLGLFTYDVTFQKMSDEDHGSTDLAEKKIWINTRFSKEIQAETLFHELLHVAYEDCSLFKNPCEKEDDTEEYSIRYISPKIVNYIDSNGWVKDFIFGN